MSTIVLRSVKGTPLTNAEVDANFSNLNTDKYQAGGALGTPASGVVTNLTGTASININGTVGATTASTGAFTTLTTSSTVTHNAGTANGVAFLNASKVLTTGSALTYDAETLANDTGSTAGTTGFRATNSVANGYTALTLRNTGASGKTYEVGVGGNGVAGNYQNNLYIRDTSGNPLLYLNSTNTSVANQFVNARAAGADTYINHSTAGVNNTVLGFNNSGSTNSSSVPNNTAYLGSLNAYSTAVVGNGATIATFVSSAQGTQGININGTTTSSGNITIGNAAAATNVALNLNGVVNKAQRIVFQNSGVEQWLIGAGAASETSAFEIYNSNGTMELSINKSTSVATFAGGTISVTGTGSRGVRLTGKGAGEVAIGGDGTTYVLAHNFYNTTAYSTQLGGMYTYVAGGALQYLSIGTGYNTAGIYIDPNNNVGVGSDSPSTKLEVLKQGNSSGGTMMLTGSKTNNATKYGYMTGAHYTSSSYPQGIGIIGCTALSGENNISIGGDPGEFLAATSIKFYTAVNSVTAGGAERGRFTSGGIFQAGTIRALGTSVGTFEATNWFIQPEDSSTIRSYVCGPNASTYATWEHYVATSTGTPVLAQRWNADGNIVVRNIGVGATIPTTSGTGITFPATQSASSNANTLDDYEEGTIDGSSLGLAYSTPGTSSFTYSDRRGAYTKVGRVVYFTLDIRLSSFSKGTASGGLFVVGLPFAQRDTGGFDGARCTVQLYDWTYTTSPIIAVVGSNNTNIQITRMVSNAVTADIDDPNGNSIIWVTGFYFV